MPVKIRLTRTGRKKLPSYRVVVADSQASRDGRYIAKGEIYDPKENPPRFLIDEKQTLKWLHRGAQPTETVRSLLRQVGVWKKFHDEKKERKAVA